MKIPPIKFSLIVYNLIQIFLTDLQMMILVRIQMRVNMNARKKKVDMRNILNTWIFMNRWMISKKEMIMIT